jgi:hypothetical protein
MTLRRAAHGISVQAARRRQVNGAASDAAPFTAEADAWHIRGGRDSKRSRREETCRATLDG